ncbi:MAG: class I SAM-dependent methyltransferase [Phycisphaerales bacterium]|nr:class I SAM-dependent methyltransferase [Phycisphaerales bacterium]
MSPGASVTAHPATWRDDKAPAKRPQSPAESFRFPYYQRLNQRRLEHLASLGLPLQGRSVLEVGAGVGDLTTFWLDRGCRVHATDGRPAHEAILRQTFAGDPRLTAGTLDLDEPGADGAEFEIVFCYGLLYHLRDPLRGLEHMSSVCSDLLLIETCVSVGEGEAINPVEEDCKVYSQAISGQGCRPTRAWVFNRLRERFAHVYCPVTQPAHEEFPLDWSRPAPAGALTRAVFVASRKPLDLPALAPGLPPRQRW